MIRWVKGYEGRVAVDWFGKAYRMTDKGLKESKAKKFLSIDGKQFTIARLVWETFKGPIPEGMHVAHKSIKTDHAVPNLKLCKGSGQPNVRRKPVAKIDRFGEIIEIYPSINECAKRNKISMNTVWNHCSGEYHRNGKMIKIHKDALAVDGYKYRYMED